MQKISGGYWRLWSGKLSTCEAKRWLKFFEKGTYKYQRLNDYIEGYKIAPNNFDDAINILNIAFPKKPNNKTSLTELVQAIKKIGTGTRHDLKKAASLENFGGPWNGSLKPYITILELTNIIVTNIGKANNKSCQIYTYNSDITHWRLPSTKFK